MGHPIALELPRPRTTPLERAAGAFARMAKPERRLAEECLGADDALFIVRTATRVDVGSWLRGARVWACALRRELALLAWGRRPYAERVPFRRLRASVYNPVTGELALAPAPGTRVRGLKMPPLDGYQLLAQIYHEEGDDAEAPD